MVAVEQAVIQGQGRTESEWLGSPMLAAVPTIELSQLLHDRSRLVIVAPHPDDEVLGCGGLIAMASRQQAGVSILVVSATDGEAAYENDAVWGATRLAPARRDELKLALAALGARHAGIQRLDLGDGKLSQKITTLSQRLTELLQPDDLVLVTYEKDGHPDHEACATSAIAAARLRGARLIQYPIWAWHWSDPADASFLARAVKLQLPTDTRESKRSAIKAFATQLGRCEPPPCDPILPDWAIARFHRSFEIFIQ